MKGMFIPEITVEMFRNACLESIEALMAEGEVYDIEYDPKSEGQDVPDISFGKWVSCSERLPDEPCRCLITIYDGVNMRTTVAPYHPRTKSWTLTGRMAYYRTIAWMPLPEPYKAESEEA